MTIATQNAPQTDTMWVIDAAGAIWLSSDPARVDSRDRSFTEYFTGARALQAGSFYVDRSVVGLADGILAFDIAKPRLSNGFFNGVLVASVGLDQLVRDWREVVGATPSQRIALFRMDGATVARSWEPLVPPKDPAAEQKVAAVWKSDLQGVVTGPSSIDGRRRVGAWQVLPAWNVVVTSSIGEEQALAPWRRQTAIYGAVAAFAACLLSALTWSLRRALVRLRQANTDLSGLLSEREAALVETEAVAERSADHLQRLMNSNVIGITTCNLRGILQANDAFLRMVGRDREAVEGGRVDWRALTPPEHLALGERALGQIVESGECEPFEKEYVRPDGTRVPLIVGAVRVSDAPLSWTNFFIDITDRKQAEEALKKGSGTELGVAAPFGYHTVSAFCVGGDAAYGDGEVDGLG